MDQGDLSLANINEQVRTPCPPPGAKRTSGEAAACFGPARMTIGDIERFEIPQRGSRLCYFFCSEAGEGTEQ
jgi:hypothetical protein